MSLFHVMLAVLPLLALSQAPRKISLKINLGGGPVGDFLGEDQVLDMSAFSKNVARVPIQNTDQPDVFQSQRFARSSDLALRLPVPDGIYSVTLLFAETFKPACVPGARVFDISLGTPVSGLTKVVDAFDVFQSAGCTAAHGKRFDAVPSKEGIVVHLTQRAQHPSLAGVIVEGFPAPKGDGSEYKAIARAPSPPQDDPVADGQGLSGGPGAPPATAAYGAGEAGAPPLAQPPTAVAAAYGGAMTGAAPVPGGAGIQPPPVQPQVPAGGGMEQPLGGGMQGMPYGRRRRLLDVHEDWDEDVDADVEKARVVTGRRLNGIDADASAGTVVEFDASKE